jgi:hypothetical protein
MRKSWLYLPTRSVRQSEPVLIWPALVATAMFRPQKVEVTRYRYRGTKINTPWTARLTDIIAPVT